MKKGSFCQRFRDAIKRLKSKFNRFLEEHIETALHITQGIKNFIDSPVADVLVHLTPTTADDKVLEKTRKALAVAVQKLSIIETCNEHENLEDKIKCWITEIGKQPVDVQNALIVKFGAIVAAELDNNKEAQHVYDSAVQSVYSVKKESI